MIDWKREILTFALIIVLNSKINYNLLASLLKEIKTNEKEDLIHSSLDVQIGEDHNRSKEKLFSNDERNKLVSYIPKSIQNLSLKISGKVNNVGIEVTLLI